MIVNQTTDTMTKIFRTKGHHTSHYQLKFNKKLLNYIKKNVYILGNLKTCLSNAPVC